MKWDEIQHFDSDEWGKDPSKASPELVRVTDEIRGVLGVPLHIHVCWDDGGHSDKSYHYTGQAADGRFDGDAAQAQGVSHWDELLAFLSFPEVGGLGFYPGWSPRPGWHWDVRNDRPRLFWAYMRGAYHYGIPAIVEAIRSVEGQ